MTHVTQILTLGGPKDGMIHDHPGAPPARIETYGTFPGGVATYNVQTHVIDGKRYAVGSMVGEDIGDPTPRVLLSGLQPYG